jgi:putative ABC transport system substrate-binding protein
VATEPDLILAWGRGLVEALGGATTTIPIVGLGSMFRPPFIQTLARPAGNITGTGIGGPEAFAKDLQLLSNSVPAATRVGYLATQGSWDGPVGASLRQAAGGLGLELSAVIVESPVNDATIRAAFAGVDGGALDALYIGPLNAFTPYDALIARLALEHRLPAMSSSRGQTEAGLLMSYAADDPTMFHRGAYYVDRILAGTDPGEMAIEQPTEFAFVVNLRTAEALGLALPPEIIVFATEVIE